MKKIGLSRIAALAVWAGGAVAAERPNILVILTDDQGYHDLGGQGAADLKTPNIDALAASDGTVVPAKVFSNLRETPGEIPAKALQNPEQKQMLANELDAWLRQLEADQKTMPPPEPPLTKMKKPAVLTVSNVAAAVSQ